MNVSNYPPMPKLLRQVGIHKIQSGLDHMISDHLESCVINRVHSVYGTTTTHSVIKSPSSNRFMLKVETVSPMSGTDVVLEPLEWLLGHD